MALLAYCHYKALAAHSENLDRLEALLRSARPESWKLLFQLKRLRDNVQSQAYISTEETIQVFAALLREGHQMGPNGQEVLQAHVEPLIEALGLRAAVWQEAEGPLPVTAGRSR